MNKTQLPRNWRNNNPLNIRRSADKWQGLVTHSTDKSFAQFEKIEYGWRAAFMLLCRKYYYTYHLNTIAKIISRWAPAQENNTQTYIEWVAAQVGVEANSPLPLPTNENEDVWMRLALAMAMYEGRISTTELLNVDIWKIQSGWDMYRIEADKGRMNP